MERTTGRRGVGASGRVTGDSGGHRPVKRDGASGSGTPPPSGDTSSLRRGGGPPPSGGGRSGTLGGMPLGAKFAVFTALAVAVASSVLVVMSSISAGKQMDQEINDAGIRMVKVVSAYAIQTIEKARLSSDPVTEIERKSGRLAQLVTEAGNQPTANTLNNEIRSHLAEIQKLLSVDPLAKNLGTSAEEMDNQAPEIINIVVTLGESQLISAKSPEAISIGSPVPIESADKTVKIREGRYQGAVRVREFKKTVKDEKGIDRGTVLVFLSARRIDDAKSAILTALMLPLVLAIVIGAAIGFFLSTIVTKPLKTLMNDINIVSAGELEHETKPQSTDEIGYLAKTFNLMTKSLASAHEAELQNKAMEHELNIATEIQSQLLPHRIPKIPGYELGAYYRPSKEVGGDYYDFIQIDQNHLGIIVADVSGKGIPGSMVMTMARSLIRMEAERNLSTADTLVKTNRILARDIRKGMFVTSLYALLDIRSRTLLISSAGHNPMVVVRKALGKYELVNPNGIALGFDKGPIFERTIKEQQIQLQPGDRVVLYTDGVVEAMDAKNVEFGDERFYKMCHILADKDSNVFINTIVKNLDEHKGDAPQHDDITLVSVRVLPQ